MPPAACCLLPQVSEQVAKGFAQFQVESCDCIIDKAEWTPAKHHKLDYRTIKPERREIIAKDLAISNVELVRGSLTLEVGTVEALMTEVQIRVGSPEGSVLIPPTQALSIARDGLDAVNPSEEEARWAESVRAATRLYIIVHSENPSHFTYLEVAKNEAFDHTIVFKDSLPNPPETARAAARAILARLELVPESFEGPSRSNKAFQTDGWSCGLWATRWLERSLREARGEARRIPSTLKDIATRGNEFIDKLKTASSASLESRRKRAREKAEPKAEPKQRQKFEPTFKTLEEALEAAKHCKKCLCTRAMTKGCRACMGEHFEQIRQKRKPEEPEEP